jgi:tetratricopeptide (TPR) repeat protein
MRHLMTCCAALGLLVSRGSGQEIPEYTKERAKAVSELLGPCFMGGGIVSVDTPDGKGKFLRVADRTKLKATLAAHKDSLTADLRDGLTAFLFRANETSEEAAAALLEALGEVKEDQQALGMVAYFRAKKLERSLQWKEAVDAYLVATKHFEAARQPLWQAASLNNLGWVHKSRGAYEEALGSIKQSLELKRKLYPPEHFKDGHADLALSLNNLAAMHQYRGA